MPKRRPDVTVTIEGSPWTSIEKGFYNFEATVDGKPSQLRVSEEVAFDLLGAWTLSQALCLDILRLHRSELAENLALKLRMGGHALDSGLYSLTLRNMERIKPKVHKRPAPAPTIDDIDQSRRGSIAAGSQSVL
jgi:hypothetical protein